AVRPPRSGGGAARCSEGWRFPDPLGGFGPGSISAFGVGSGGSHLVVHKGDTNIAESGKGTRSHFVDQSRLESQRNAWTSPASPYKSGALRKYADQIGLTDVSSVAQAGGKAEVVCLAAIYIAGRLGVLRCPRASTRPRLPQREFQLLAGGL